MNKRINLIKKNAKILIVLGVLLIAIANILKHAEKISDVSNGLMSGVAIGFLVVSVITLAKKRQSFK
ncbi:hypothetical protein [Zunongwangia pacifica]|uniref:Uncharacterized protein n=1 Tax=Zunongwangia pacifica TaxID=2911062 RepID=A0A9X1ZVE0_9FLAO|nr:hypothetical protein [Zunongwangia pacifica]MCL6219148.1 hypothetical protein [Zunongwangia pacifica]